MSRDLGKLNLSDFILHLLEEAIRASFEARRGKDYDALRALNPLLILDLADQPTVEEFTSQELHLLAIDAIERQMEKGLEGQFRFFIASRKALRK